MSITEQLHALNQVKNNLPENERGNVIAVNGTIVSFSDNSYRKLKFDSGINVVITKL